MRVNSFLYSWSVVFLSIVLSLCGGEWFTVWLGMELNLFGAIPFLLGDSKGEVESAFKYFLVQTFGSMVFLFSIIEGLWLGSFPAGFLMMIGLIVKLGAAPFHFWVPVVLMGSPMGVVWFILSVQKIVPLFVIFVSCDGSFLLLFCGVLSVFVGSFSGLGCNRFCSLLGYSSILHMGWFLGSCLTGFVTVFVYFLCYFVTISSLCWLVPGDCYLYEVGSVSYFLGYKWGLCFLILSLGGFPPFLGFFGKLLVLVETSGVYPIFSFLLVIGSVCGWYYYLYLFCFFVLYTGSLREWSKVDLFMPIAIFGGLVLMPFFVF
nr:NADH dehydrogenase subunit 2 [Propeamussium sp. mt1]